MFETYIKEQKDSLNRLKDNLKTTSESLAQCKVLLQSYTEERGKPESSLLADTELLLGQFSVEHEAYHGGDFNGLCCQRIVGNGAEIIKELRKIMREKKMHVARTVSLTRS